jgi:hypothetical protein
LEGKTYTNEGISDMGVRYRVLYTSRKYHFVEVIHIIDVLEENFLRLYQRGHKLLLEVNFYISIQGCNGKFLTVNVVTASV